MRRTLMMVLASVMLMTGIASAQEKTTTTTTTTKTEERAGHDLWGVEVHPYVYTAALRPSGPDEWAMALGAGAEFELNPFWIGVDYQLYDVLDDDNVYPFDGAFALKLGLYRGDGDAKLFEIETYPHAAVVLSRPSGPDEWSTGFEAGVEFDLDPLYLDTSYTLRDILTDEDSEVYDWSGDFALGLGVYW